jgi:diaminohydroxyphosphoribosylaminopyrimidine deaminase/5-amino-6-(5-phosphoribosylamino)uracil reductase
VSLDGKIATRTGDSRWIAGPQARARAHELRHECDAIMIGAGTVVIDDPLLTDRSTKPRRLPLTRVVLDERLQTSPASQLASTAREAPVWLFSAAFSVASSGIAAASDAAAALETLGVAVICDAAGGRDVLQVLEELGHRSIQSVLVEGGGGIAGAFIDAAMVNKFTFFVAPVIIGGREAPTAVAGLGVEQMADALRLEEVEITLRGADVEVSGYPRRREE